MPVIAWPKVEIEAEEVVMPRTCPNCMADAEYAWRTDYKLPLGSTRWFQTFYYCGECTAMMKWRRRTQLFAWLVGFAGLAAGIALPAALGAKGGTFLAIAIAVPVVAVTALLIARRRPLPKDAVIGDYAAYLTGKSGLGLGKKSIYRALRTEWLDRLVELNPGAVDDATYKAHTGRDKPVKDKPF